MEEASFTPRILIIDDLYGRTVAKARNEERASLCGQYLLRDVSGDESQRGQPQRIKQPIAEAVFHRGQRPACSSVGDFVENDPESVLQAVKQGWIRTTPARQRWSLVLLDLCFFTGLVTPDSDRRAVGMPEGRDADDDPNHYFGLQVLRVLHNELPDLPILILSSKPRADVSREFSEFGALGFLERDAEDSPALLKTYIQRHGFIPDTTGRILGSSYSLLKVLRAARRAAQARQNLLIRGERGTGKELLARYVHECGSAVSPGPLVTVDSGSLAPELYASALFGYRKGAFTGADQNRAGSIAEAHRGDLFLDEIGNMPVEVQKGLLRVLEYRRVLPLGGNPAEAIEVDVRFLSATNADIESATLSGNFREDLYDRLQEGGVLHLPPLRERPEDIPALIEAFVRMAEARTPGSLRRVVEPESLDLLCRHDWPGNIRQLRNSIFNAVANHPDVEHLVPDHLDLPASAAVRRLRQPDQTAADPTVPARSIQQLLTTLMSTDFDAVGPEDLAGTLYPLQEAWAKLMARYLRAGLHATKRPTPANPAGEFFLLPAMQLLTGDERLRAWKAYDLIKRVLQTSDDTSGEILADPVLRKSMEKAWQSRNRKPRRP
jgi:DNA-binding NtrC family response regulator